MFLKYYLQTQMSSSPFVAHAVSLELCELGVNIWTALMKYRNLNSFILSYSNILKLRE